jgi:hypothetical protein
MKLMFHRPNLDPEVLATSQLASLAEPILPPAVQDIKSALEWGIIRNDDVKEWERILLQTGGAASRPSPCRPARPSPPALVARSGKFSGESVLPCLAADIKLSPKGKLFPVFVHC